MNSSHLGIGTQKESCLHRQLKEKYTQTDGANEIPVKNYICDILNPNNEIIEIQTRCLSSLKAKLLTLLPEYKVTVVHPIAADKFIERTDPATGKITRRKSPRHGNYSDIFAELTKLYPLLIHPNLTIKLVLMSALERQIADGTGSWRRRGNRIEDRELLKIQEERNFTAPQQYLGLLPPSLANEFTVADLKKSGFKYPGKTVWVLRHLNLLTLQGKKGRAYVYKQTTICPVKQRKGKSQETMKKLQKKEKIIQAREVSK